MDGGDDFGFLVFEFGLCFGVVVGWIIKISVFVVIVEVV